jgi:hypothetical protein
VLRVLALAALALLGGIAGGVVGYAVGAGDETVTVTTTVEEGQSGATVSGLPAAVTRTRAALLEAAKAGDYEAVAALAAPGFRYTFGGPVRGGPAAYWRELERTGDARPLEKLATILELPSALSRGYYVWPWAHTVAGAEDLSPHERTLLAPLGRIDTLFAPGTGYLGWRTGIAPDGSWTYFVAGD